MPAPPPKPLPLAKLADAVTAAAAAPTDAASLLARVQAAALGVRRGLGYVLLRTRAWRIPRAEIRARMAATIS